VSPQGSWEPVPVRRVRASSRRADGPARRTPGHFFAEAALANLALVLERSGPFADDPRAPAEKAAKLVTLHDNLTVG
jgi:hypothetical protein